MCYSENKGTNPPFEVHAGERAGSMKAYGSRWERKREHILRRDKYRSKLSERYGKLVQADTVHHILPVEFFPEYKFTDWNLISITGADHNTLHDRETHRLTKEGMDLAIRTARQQGLNVVEILSRLER